MGKYLSPILPSLNKWKLVRFGSAHFPHSPNHLWGHQVQTQIKWAMGGMLMEDFFFLVAGFGAEASVGMQEHILIFDL